MPWEDVLPINSDFILRDAIKNGDRPDLKRPKIYKEMLDSKFRPKAINERGIAI